MKKLLSLALALCLIIPPGCSQAPKKFSESFQAMDTFMRLDIYGADCTGAIRDDILSLESRLSAADPDSELGRVNADGGGEFGADTAELTRRTLALCEETGGALDITVYPIVEEWGFISKSFHIPDETRLQELLKNVGYSRVAMNGSRIELPEGCRLDFGAVAKGYAADRAVAQLKKDKASGAILNLGGTIVAYGKKPGGSAWSVGIADPENSADHMGRLSCSDRIIATSGSYERCFEGEDGRLYSHIIDPKTGRPVDNGILSVTVVSESGLRADALSTALFVMGVDKAMDFYRESRDFDCVILTADRRAYVSKGVADSFRTADGHDYKIIIIE